MYRAMIESPDLISISWFDSRPIFVSLNLEGHRSQCNDVLEKLNYINVFFFAVSAGVEATKVATKYSRNSKQK